MSYLHKRKRVEPDQPEPPLLSTFHEAQPHGSCTESLCVEAYEADLVPGKDALAFALEAPETDSAVTSTDLSPGSRGSGLIKWDIGVGAWVDRFDARLLLSELPASCSVQNETEVQSGSPQSPSGWSDLPSDTEDAFFLSPSEVDDLRRTKRRRVLEDARAKRLSALHATGEGGVVEDDAGAWGGSDEEPDAMQAALMERTAAHLHASPDRARLAARILTNHGADKRFAFMRGRWRRAWIQAQAKVVAAAKEEEEEKKKAKVLESMGLDVYGDSDEEVGGEEDKPSEILHKEDSDEAAKMEARRARAREWAAKRRAEKEDRAEEPLTR